MLTYEQTLALLDDSENAVRPGPGRFEGNEDLRVAEAVWELSLDTANLDDQWGSIVEEGYWSGLIGRFVVLVNPDGFIMIEAHDTEEAAKLAFLCH